VAKAAGVSRFFIPMACASNQPEGRAWFARQVHAAQIGDLFLVQGSLDTCGATMPR